MGLTEMMGSQARKPSGLPGRVMGYLMSRGHMPLAEWTIEQVNIQPDDHVLDIGCGGGMTIKQIARIAEEGFVAGIDLSEIMVKQALKCNKAMVRSGHVEIKYGNVSNLPYKNESFDKVCSIESFYFWHDLIPNLTEVYRVLKPTGLVAIGMEWSKEMSNPQKQKCEAMADKMEFKLYSGAEMVEMLTTAGFSQARFVTNPDKNWFCAVGVR